MPDSDDRNQASGTSQAPPLGAVGASAARAAEVVGSLRARVIDVASVKPPSLRRRSYLGVGVFVVLVGLLAPVLFTSRFHQSLVNLWLIYAIIALGYYLIFGLAGRFSFAHAYMVGLGAYVSAWATQSRPFLVGLLLAIAIVAVASLVVGLILRRAHHFYFAIGTFAAAEIGMEIIEKWEGFSGPQGSRIGMDPPELLGWEASTRGQLFWVLLGALALLLLLVVMIERSPLRRNVIASRDLEVVAQVAGVPVARTQLLFFVVGSVIGGIGGVLFAHTESFISPELFGLDLAISILLMVILGGMGTKWGPIAGALFVVLAPEYLTVINEYQSLVYGALLIVVIIVFPAGLAGVGSDVVEWLRSRLPAGFPLLGRDAAGPAIPEDHPLDAWDNPSLDEAAAFDEIVDGAGPSGRG